MVSPPRFQNVHKKLGMGLNIVWQSQIDKVLSDILDCGEFCLAIMDDLIIFSKTKQDHMTHLERILRTLGCLGLKISPRKCKLFQDKVTYMGHTILIKDGRPCITAMKDKAQAIRDLPRPTTVRKMQGFVGAVNFLSMFLPQLQDLILPDKQE